MPRFSTYLAQFFMAAKDIIHEPVKNALIKDGWVITDDPLTIRYRNLALSADLAAERPIAAERAGQKIVVEIKSFVGRSPVRDFEEALGQYHLYKALLEATEPERELYLAISERTYERLFSREAIQFVIERFAIKWFAVDVDRQEVVRWIR